MVLPSFKEFKALSLEEQIKIFDILFEHTDALVSLTLLSGSGSFDVIKLNSYNELVESVRTSLLRLIQDDDQYKLELSDIIAAHPKLGVPKEVQGTLSELSKLEQKNLNDTKNNTAEIKEALISLNEEYERKYKGLRFVCFVNGRDRQEIIHEMKQILESANTWNQEANRAINAMCDIALDRIRKL
ncbi:uncharacterized protein HGUI_00831 [Hanseniaspora guilliermondii]|uniref:Oxo-4-hydroxy-4-carboxy-5-ureidoimidazoline decarboxylase domain-containing protein n=1 Tax=Hanseniaspora guilliermondii TaxID=56406 RepID=A0A1L0CV34_9ASCO|nr:uncharacterized protein HGUI_00831 [Hanseniaspora guilliermondii]